jgi:hypothetical protein
MFLAVFMCGIASCTKEEQKVDDGGLVSPCAGFAAPSAGNSGPANSGDTILLFASSGISGVDFEWIGPEGFTAAIAQPMLAGVQYGQNGIYRARILNSSCISSYTGTRVTIHAPCPPMDENTANVNGAIWYFYDQVQCGPLGTNLYHGVTASSSSGVLYVQFNTLHPPEGYGLFGINPLPGVDTTLASLWLQQGGVDFEAQGGTLYAGDDGDSAEFIFCGVPFKSPGGLVYPVTASLRCK